MPSKLIVASIFAAAIAAAFTPAVAAPDQKPGMAMMSAYVDVEGNLTGGAGAAGAAKTANGTYFVAFSRSVEGCAHVAAVSGPGAFVYPGFVTSVGTLDTLDGVNYYGVQVDTMDHNALIADRPFHLMVFCAQ